MATPVINTVTIAKYKVNAAKAVRHDNTATHHFLLNQLFSSSIKEHATSPSAMPISAPVRVKPTISAKIGDATNGTVKKAGWNLPLRFEAPASK